MAQNGQQGKAAPVAAVDTAKPRSTAAPTAATAPTPEAPGARETQGGREAQGGGETEGKHTEPTAQNAPAENLDLTADAQKELEEKKLEEQKKLQEQIEAVQQQIEDTKTQIEQAAQAKDGKRVESLTQQLHGLEAQLAGLVDQAAGQQPQHNPLEPVGGPGGGPALIPPPVGGGGGGGGGFNPYAFGNMGMGMPAGVGNGGHGGLNAGNFAPAADPSVNIPSFGKNADKGQVGQMLDAASKKYGIPQNILKAVAWQESKWDPKALSFDGQHGKGVMQIDDRFHEFARTPDVFDPAKNIDYGAKYLANLYKETGSWQAALKRYNGGSDYPPKVLALAEQQPWSRQV